MGPRSETSSAALARLQGHLAQVVDLFSAGRSALPTLAMGTDPDGVVHVGLDAAGAVVRLDLDPQWRAALGPTALGPALAQAVQQAAQVRTGDWASAVAARSGQAEADDPDDDDPPTTVALTPDPGWLERSDDERVRAGLLELLTPHQEPPAGAVTRPDEVRELTDRTASALRRSAATLPPFMRAPVRHAVGRVREDVVDALALPLAGQGAAVGALGDFGAHLQHCLWLSDQPAGLPEAAQVWATAAAELTSGLAAVRRPSWRSRRRSAS